MKEETLFKDEFLSLLQLDGWYRFSHMSRTAPAEDGSGQGVAILVYTTANNRVDRILGRFENCLPHRSDADGLTSITGGVDPKNTVVEAALQELDEEAGYEGVTENQLLPLGTCRPSKQEDSLWHLFAFDATGLKRREQSVGDGTEGEKGAYCDWVQPYQLVLCKCPLPTLIMVRAGLLDKLV